MASAPHDEIRVAPLSGAALAERIDDLAALRIAVFRDWPYLYEGDIGYERAYLAAYTDSPRAIVVGALAGDRLVGAATATPLADHEEDLAAPFEARGIDIGTIYYCGESVLLPEWRGRGIGHAFFDHREAAGRAHGFATSAFCAVARPADHPLRPAGYRPLDPFWRKRGYAPVEGLVARFAWADVGENGAEIGHPMQFWVKALR